jgi:monothiol glutaredoxin
VLSHLGVKFKSIDVLSEPDIREGIKHYSNWPTIPQLYVKSEFVGGADIIREMFESGELVELLNSRGVEAGSA